MLAIWTVAAVVTVVATLAGLWFTALSTRDYLKGQGDGIIPVLLLLPTAMCGFLAVVTGTAAYNRATLQSEQRVMTVVESKSETTYITQTTLVGQSVIVTTVPLETTEFTTKEVPGRTFSCSGLHEWKPGQRVKLRVYVRNGEIVTYDFEGTE